MLTIADVSKAFGPQSLFEEVSLQISRADRVGFKERKPMIASHALEITVWKAIKQ
jgi:hypothetical protein